MSAANGENPKMTETMESRHDRYFRNTAEADPAKLVFRAKLQDLLISTLEEGPGSRAVGRITAECLYAFIANEAGAFTPQAVEEVVYILETLLEEASSN
jgi:hypothetical protein